MIPNQSFHRSAAAAIAATGLETNCPRRHQALGARQRNSPYRAVTSSQSSHPFASTALAPADSFLGPERGNWVSLARWDWIARGFEVAPAETVVPIPVR